MRPFDTLARRYLAWLARVEAAAEARSSFEAAHPDATVVDILFRGEEDGARFFAILYSTGQESGSLSYKLLSVSGDEASEVSPEEWPEYALTAPERRPV